MSGQLYPVSAVEALLGVSERQLTRYKGEDPPLPVAKPGRGGSHGSAAEYDLNDVLNWYVNRRLSSMNVDDDGHVYDEKLERAKNMHYAAEIKRLEFEKKEGELWIGEQVAAVLSRILANLRSGIMPIGASCSRAVVGESDIREVKKVIDKYTREALEDCSVEMENLLNDFRKGK